MPLLEGLESLIRPVNAEALELRNVSYERSEGIATVMIDRQQKLNALDSATIAELMQIFLSARSDAEVQTLILTGAGEKAFVAGGDIAEMSRMTPTEARAFAAKGQALTRLMELLGKPVIAAVNGYALGGGCELAMACTFRIASERAKFGQPEVKLGMIPGFGGTQRLARLVGKGRALELLLTGAMIDAQEALRIGLVNRVTTSEELLSVASEISEKIIVNGPLAVRGCIEAVNQGLEMPLDDALTLEANLFALGFDTEDMREGTRAFLEKRPAKFQGK